MKTYLTLIMDSSGAKPSEVSKILLALGFKPTRGPHDYVYEWTDARDLQDVIWFADKVHDALTGTGALFKMETVG